MRLLTSKYGDLSTCFDKIDETEGEIDNSSLKHILINNHTIQANKGKIVRQLPLEHLFGFCKTFKKITKNLGFHLIFKTADLQDIIYATLPDATNIGLTLNSLYLYVPSIIPSPETQIMFIDSIKNSFTLSFNSWTSDRKIVNTGLEFQVYVGSAQNINSPKYLIISHQTANRSSTSNKAINNAIFDNFDIRKHFCEIDAVRYPKDKVVLDYETNNYLNQNRALKNYGICHFCVQCILFPNVLVLDWIIGCFQGFDDSSLPPMVSLSSFVVI